MKKLFFTLALILSVFALSAQSYQVTERETGIIIENGATYYVYGDGAATWGELNIEFNVTTFEHVRLIGEKVENNVIDGTMNYFCWGQCLSPFVYVSDPYDMPADSTDVFSMHYIADDMSTVLGMEQSMTYYLYEANNPDDKFIINVIFKYSAYGIEDNNIVEEFSNAYPTPAKDVVSFDCNFSSSSNEAYVAIYSMTGQEVMRSEINALQGKVSLNVSDLADGVYFYSLIVNGQTKKSSKLVIKK